MNGSWGQIFGVFLLFHLQRCHWVALFLFYLNVWCVMRLMHDGAHFQGVRFLGNGTAGRNVVSFLKLKKKQKKSCFQMCEMDGKKKLFTHMLASTTPEKKKENQISWKCILSWHLFLICRHELGFQLQMASEMKHTTLFAICSRSYFQITLFSLFFEATKALLHGLGCPALFCVWVCWKKK